MCLKKATQKLKTKGSSPLLVVLGLNLIVILSGCIQSSPVFDPEQAELYNPISNQTERLRIVNHNDSGKSFYHQNEIEILVGLRDTKGNPGVNYSLLLKVVYTFYGETESENISDKLGILLVTNDSGIAQSTFAYDQYTWPHGVNTEGYFEISSNKIPNSIAISSIFTFTYYHSQISRNSTSEGGVEVIYNFENRSLYEEAISLGNDSNDFVDWTKTYGEYYPPIINAARINTHSRLVGAPYIEFMYKAWAFYFDPLNLSYQQIRATWKEYIKVGLNDFSEDDWLSTGSLSRVNVSSGWLILQYMYESYFVNGLEGGIDWWYQIAILDDDFHLKWLLFRFDYVES
ncbi:MAG: hypothetical protein JSW11_13685 [Candidatus Heimdallarchaeota archaeon]|nr:MAG: hypothetical protein JSW11_13685 [Candidatus Heimdallarchaeota archaeon]